MKNDNGYANFLEGRERVSLPEIQLAFECGYARAKQIIRDLQIAKWVSGTVEGLYYAVNSKFIFRRKLKAAECSAIWDDLEKSDLDLLGDLRDDFEGEIDEDGDYDDDDGSVYTLEKIHDKELEEELEHLMGHGLVHLFDDEVFLSITKESANRINDSIFMDDDDDNISISYIAHPMLIAIIKNNARESEVIALPFVPRSCQKYVADGLRRYRRDGIFPPKLLNDVDDDELDFFFNEDSKTTTPTTGKMNVLKYEIMEAFIGACSFRTKTQYINEAERNVALIRESSICSVAFKKASEDALKDIKSLTLSNIKEIRKIIKETESFDDDE